MDKLNIPYIVSPNAVSGRVDQFLWCWNERVTASSNYLRMLHNF